MFAILGEDASDAATLKELVKRLAKKASLPVKTKGFNGCGELLRKGKSHLNLFAGLGCTRFIVCLDADGLDPKKKNRKAREQIVAPSKVSDHCCIVVPVQEIEAWILADITAVTNIFKGWNPKAIKNVESINDPKEYLERLSREGKPRPRYSHATHNERMAKYLDLEKVEKSCPSFKPLADFVRKSVS